MAVDRGEILQAEERIRSYVQKTPVRRDPKINRNCHAYVFFKCEHEQPIGVFKIRGAMNAVLSLKQNERQRGIATHSSGNHARAIAYAGREFGIPAHIVMPTNAPPMKRRAVEELGATIYACEPTEEARRVMLQDVVTKTGAVPIEPFDDEHVIAGQATAGKEFLEEVPELDVIVTPVGGGGLLSGTALAARFFARQRIDVYGAEPEGANDTVISHCRGRRTPCPRPRTICDGLRTTVGELTFPIIRKEVAKIFEVSDREVAFAMREIRDCLGAIVEPNAAVPYAAVRRHHSFFFARRIGIILSGGNIDPNRFERLCRAEFRPEDY